LNPTFSPCEGERFYLAARMTTIPFFLWMMELLVSFLSTTCCQY